MAWSRLKLAGATTFAVTLAACSFLTDTDRLADAPPTGKPEIVRVDAGDASPAVDVREAGRDVATGSAYRDAVMMDAPLAYFPFDEPAGATFAKDIVGGRVASVVGKVTFGVAGIGSGAVSFDGTGHLDAGDVLDWIDESPVTFELWARPTTSDGTFRNLLEKRVGTPSLMGYVFYFRDTPTSFQMEDYSSTGSARSAWIAVPDTPLVHFVYTFDPKGGAHFYANGIQSTSAFAGSGGAPNTDAPLIIGGTFIGTLDELAIYDHALSPERVNAHLSARN